MGVLITRSTYWKGNRSLETQVGMADGDCWDVSDNGTLLVLDASGEPIGEFKADDWNTVMKVVTPVELEDYIAERAVGLIEQLVDELEDEEYAAAEEAAYAEKAEREAAQEEDKS